MLLSPRRRLRRLIVVVLAALFIQVSVQRRRDGRTTTRLRRREFHCCSLTLTNDFLRGTRSILLCFFLQPLCLRLQLALLGEGAPVSFLHHDVDALCHQHQIVGAHPAPVILVAIEIVHPIHSAVRVPRGVRELNSDPESHLVALVRECGLTDEAHRAFHNPPLSLNRNNPIASIRASRRDLILRNTRHPYLFIYNAKDSRNCSLHRDFFIVTEDHPLR